MRRLSLILLTAGIFLSVNLFADSPHGKDFKISCGVCHSQNSWKLDKTIYSFDHGKTALPLVGQHLATDCKGCHPTLVFSDAKTACVDCHTDMHYQTVGPDCGRCHTPASWIVNNVTEIHQRSRFPLTGAHYTANCSDCHVSASLLRFEPLGVECYDCHSDDYLGTTEPNHAEAGYSTNCLECHSMNSITWTGGGINHNFFPLTLGHAISDCNQCHTNGNFSGTSPECFSCHQEKYNQTNNPNHIASNFSTTCTDCHTTNPGWKPAEYRQHDNQFFPIYSGKHVGTWTACAECHANPADYTSFTCIDCHDHNQPETDQKHEGVGGYSYASIPCFECHPTGSAEGSFNHNSSAFPLTGAHITTPCSNCHVSGYAGTPTGCPDCHMPAYNQTTDPNHSAIGIPTTCATCHSTDPGWKPAIFPDHNNYFPLTGAHITAGCNSCHANGYAGTPTACSDCHMDAYNQTTNPNHSAINIPLTCATCHSTDPGWKPAIFPDHDNYYPLTGAHASVDCFSCHQNNYNNTPNTCVGCHQDKYNQTTNPSHTTLGLSTNCATCHTTNPGWQPALFPNHNNYYVLAGAHITQPCDACHNGNYNNNIPNTCVGCHLDDYNQTNNPPHASAQFPTNCEICHSQNAWVPSTFDHDGQYFPIYSGKHNGEWNLCSDCHTNPNNYQVFSCFGCHSQPEMDDKHNGVPGYSYNNDACLQCHPDGNAPMMKAPKINKNQN
jgi:hypothetical protein